jgi:hypothetical protein
MLTLRRACTCALAGALSLASARAGAQDTEDGGLYRPERLTVGIADDLLGSFAPDGKTLYYVSNRNTVSQVFAQSVTDGRAHMLFDDDADVTWPRISPDGKHLLYISFGERASGQLCLRDLPSGEGRRCLEDPSAALQAEWVDDGRIVVVGRQSIQGDLRILEVTAGPRLSARPLMDRNLTSPAVSPDGKWLVYVPVERDVQAVGPAFAAHGAGRIEIAPFGSSTTPGVALPIDLPGITGQPAFARDGRALYVVQFFIDSNHDGVIDATDNGVLFRVPLSFEKGTPMAGTPEQLTETSWNCEYPAPARDKLAATCSRDGSLDVYAFPLDGEVPPELTLEQLAAEVDVAATRVDKQLLASRLLARSTATSAHRLALLSLALLDLDLDAYDAAEFHAKHVADLHDPATAGLGHPLAALVDQRRSMRDRERGRLIGRFTELARARLDQLKLSPKASPMAVAFAHVVRSEIADSFGDKAMARAELEAASLDATTALPIVEAYYQRADAFYREVDDHEALVATCRRLAESPALTPDEQLRYARAAARSMVRGLAFDEGRARLIRERVTSADGSETAFAIDLAIVLNGIRTADPPPAVAEALLGLYAAQTRSGRRRVLVDDAVARATSVNADRVVEDLAQRNIAGTPRGTPDRRGAERLFRRVMTGRAYRDVGAKRFAEARADFDAIVEQTGSLEAVVGAIDARLKLDEPPARIEASYLKPATTPAQIALSAFARAYILARRLPKIDGDEHAKADADAMALLHASWSDLKSQRIAQALDGALLHEEYLRTGDLASVEKANVHYLIALELVTTNPRFRAMILGELGLLHARVGNYRIALEYLEERDKLPYAENSEGLAVRLAMARCLLHVGRESDAATVADQALATIDRTPGLAPYRALVLDRAALDNLAAGRFARAVTLYDLEMPLLDPEAGLQGDRNRFVARVARAAAAIGAGQAARAADDLARVEHDLSDPTRSLALGWPHASIDDALRTYRLIVSGLRAEADGALGQLDTEAQALAARRAILDARFLTTARSEDERAAMLAEAQLAVNATERHDAASASSWLVRALARADDLRSRAGGEVDQDGLEVLRLAAELDLATPGAPLVADLRQRLQAAVKWLEGRRDPALRRSQRWLEIYLPLTPPVPGKSSL